MSKGQESWKVPSWQSGYNLSWFEILTYREDKFVIHGEGQWSGHMMDWRGMNMRRGRLPESPVFETEKDAMFWLYNAVKSGKYYNGMELSGSFVGDGPCDRDVHTVMFGDIFETPLGKDRKKWKIKSFRKVMKWYWEGYR